MKVEQLTTMKTEREQNKNKVGFTIGELITTTAIIGTLTAIAIPNYNRIHMGVNMELVKQELKKIQSEMTQIMTNKEKFPAQDQWGNGSTPEELAITASLFSIDKKDYTIEDYTTDIGQSTYTFKTCPKEGKFGIAGDKCFILTPMEITESQADAALMASGPEMAAQMIFGLGWKDVFGNGGWMQTVTVDFFKTNLISPEKKAQLFANTLEYLAYYVAYCKYMPCQEPYAIGANAIPSLYLPIPQKDVPLFKELFASALEYLKATGILDQEIRIQEREVAFQDMKMPDWGSNIIPSVFGHSGIMKQDDAAIFEIGFELMNPPTENRWFDKQRAHYYEGTLFSYQYDISCGSLSECFSKHVPGYFPPVQTSDSSANTEQPPSNESATEPSGEEYSESSDYGSGFDYTSLGYDSYAAFEADYHASCTGGEPEGYCVDYASYITPEPDYNIYY